MAKKRGIFKKIVVFVLIAGLCGGGYWYLTNRNDEGTTQTGAAVRTASVIRGDISSMVSGSGSVATSREQALAAPGASTLLQIHVEDGDMVARGDILFVLDCPEVESSQQAVSKYEFQLAEYYAAKNELQRVAEKEYLVTTVNARIGEKLTRNANLLSLLDISTMSIQVPAETGGAWEEGQQVQVTLLEYGNTVMGILSGTPTFSRINGMDYLSFTLQLDRGQRIAAETYGQAFNRSTNNQSAVLLRPNTETQIRVPADGYLEELYATEGEIIEAGELMYRIDSTSLDSQISDANSEMQVAMENLKQKQTTLVADFDGIYYAAADSSGPKNTFLQVGDSMRTNDSLGKVVDSDRMQIVFNVDELDIAKVEVGQEVTVVADALPDRTYKGRVARIAQEGASSGNVAYYWVLNEVTEWEGLKVGMTSSLEIEVEKSTGTLMVPINAVRTLRGVSYVILAEEQDAADVRSGSGAGVAPVMRGDGAPIGRGDAQGAPPRGEGAGLPPRGEGQDETATPGEGQAVTQGEDQDEPLGEATDQGMPPDEGQGRQRADQGQEPQLGSEDEDQGIPQTEGQRRTAQPGGAGPSGAMTAQLQLPERAVIVQTGIINDTYAEILSGLEEGQIVELTGSAATSGGGFQGGNMMFMGPGPGAGAVVGGSTMTVVRP